jgi:hypothetical protein
VVVIGAGFIGSEAASSARATGCDVTVVEALPAPLIRGLGAEIGAACGLLHTDNDTVLHCGIGVSGITGDGSVERVHLADGTVLDADLVVVGIGVVPDTGWLEGSGLTLDDGVVCGADLAAGPPGVFAAGDCARWPNAALGGGTVRIVPTLLALHALPADQADKRAHYVSTIVEKLIPAVARESLATSVDAFCETIAFTPEEVERVFKAAGAHGLRVRLHAEQLSNQKGAALAAKYRALSADHLEHLDGAGAKAMAAAGTVAVLLPGAFYALQEERKPPVALLRKHKVPIAIATDCNPGTSPMLSPTLTMNMACTLFGLTPEEALLGMTVNAARALELASQVGSIAPGKAADLAVWPVESVAELGYWMGLPGPTKRIFGGLDS